MQKKEMRRKCKVDRLYFALYSLSLSLSSTSLLFLSLYLSLSDMSPGAVLDNLETTLNITAGVVEGLALLLHDELGNIVLGKEKKTD